MNGEAEIRTRSGLLRLVAVACVAGFASLPLPARELTSTDWLMTLETRALGPIDVVLHVRQSGEGLEARTRGVNPIVLELSGADGRFEGPVVSGKPGPRVSMTVAGDRIDGTIDAGLLRGSIHAVPFDGTLPLRDYPSILTALDAVVKRQVYRPAELASNGWMAFRREAGKIAAEAKDDFDFLFGIRSAWKSDPFSHFQLKRSSVAAETMIAELDSMRMGRESARLTFDGDVAILVVDTMMGADTIEQIEAAYAEIARRGARALVIDLRSNDGGAFAVVPLVQHVIDEPFDAGAFLSNRWWSSKRAAPTTEEIEAAEPWRGWSIITFWRDAQDRGLLRIRFEPQEPRFSGRVWVLTSAATASAAELAADALRTSGRAVLVGEKTKGAMLSGSYFDVGEGFMVFLPVADYVSRRVGRIDGAGLVPDIATGAEDALTRAISLARQR